MWHFDCTKLVFILHYVLLQCHKQAFSMLWCQQDTIAYLRLRKTWQHSCKINHELRTGMGDYCEVRISSCGNLWREFQLQLSRLVLVVVLTIVHIYNKINVKTIGRKHRMLAPYPMTNTLYFSDSCSAKSSTFFLLACRRS